LDESCRVRRCFDSSDRPDTDRSVTRSGVCRHCFWLQHAFFFPLVIVSFACWVPAIVFYVLFMRRGIHRTALTIVLPVLLLLACPYQLTVIALVLVQFSHLPPPAS
jgi:hypothetical protein